MNPRTSTKDRVMVSLNAAVLMWAAAYPRWFMARSTEHGPIGPPRAMRGRGLRATSPRRVRTCSAIYDRITVAGRRIVSVRLTPSAYAHGLAVVLPTYEIPIEGRDEWLAAARRLA